MKKKERRKGPPPYRGALQGYSRGPSTKKGSQGSEGGNLSSQSRYGRVGGVVEAKKREQKGEREGWEIVRLTDHFKLGAREKEKKECGGGKGGGFFFGGKRKRREKMGERTKNRGSKKLAHEGFFDNKTGKE